MKPYGGRPWTRVLVTVLLAVQLLGRFFVFTFIDDLWIRLLLIAAAVITVAVVWLLWIVRPMVLTSADPPRGMERMSG
ncbi:hypothetical protein DKT68_00890 [Micromonospora acroterricola]|uniref:Uncharacterized protein n=1 Tax=Micromonospora acroterricola TaxID=2202421 RepID=A0A317DG63_9ACTN|nr:hypothetical protein DKT68_00890 [Micromonospora acroterricola]